MQTVLSTLDTIVIRVSVCSFLLIFTLPSSTMKLTIFAIVSLALVSCNVFAKEIKFEECDGTKDIVQTVDVEPCTAEPCVFKKGEKVKLRATVKAKERVEAATLKVNIEMEGIEVEYPDIEPDVCKKVKCPVEAGSVVTAEYDIVAQDFFPDMTVDMKWEAKDNNNKVVFCALAKVGIQS